MISMYIFTSSQIVGTLGISEYFLIWSWGSFDYFISIFLGFLFEQLSFLLDKILQLVFSSSRVKYFFDFLYVGLVCESDNFIVGSL